MSKRVCVLLANGLEECEGLIVVDILRRAGAEVTMASIHEDKQILSSHGISFMADALLQDMAVEAFDMVVLPGGKGGTDNLTASQLVAEFVTGFAKNAEQEGKVLSAICAAPSVLGGLGLLEGRKATCFPGWEGKLRGATYTAEPVTEDGYIVTGNGLGAAIPFGLHLVARLYGVEKAEEIRQQIQYPHEV